LKAILIDDEILLMGSSNFDFASYFLEQEICIMVRDTKLVAAFKKQVLDDAIAHSSKYQPAKLLFKHHLSNALIRLATYLCKILAKFIYRKTKT
ncbi:hypothetical protein MNBD_ALPHA06-588, partial [hydrothermal vent metagenome]